MTYNPVSARRLPPDDPFFDSKPGNLPAKTQGSQSHNPHKTHGSGLAESYTINRDASDYNPQTQYAGIPGYVIPHFLNPNAGGFSGDYFPSVHGNLQQQPGSGFAFPPDVASHFPQTYFNRRDWSLESPSAVGNLSQAPINQQHSDFFNLPTLGEQTSAFQPRSVKHLTCWYWANKGCKLPEHVCLYSHFNTGRLADPPMQVQRGRPAVAGKNATVSQPVYTDWRGQQAHSAVIDPGIQRQFQHINYKAAQTSTLAAVKFEQSKTEDMARGDGSQPVEPAVSHNRAHPGDSTSPAPADAYRHMSIGIGASSQHLQHFDRSPRQMGGNFLPHNPAAYLPGGSTHYGIGGNYGGNRGPELGPRHVGGNNPNTPNTPNTPAPFAQSGSHSGTATQEMQRQMRIKDRVITELAGIVEMLEINYGISIDDQTDALQKLMNIARSMEEDAPSDKPGGKSPRQRHTSNVPAPSASGPPYGHPPAHHERILTAMEGSLNLVQMEKMVLAKSRARKQVVGGQLESIEAGNLLPRDWIER